MVGNGTIGLKGSWSGLCSARRTLSVFGIIGLMAVAVLGVAPGVASANSKIYSYSSTPSDTQAGGHPDIVGMFHLGTRFNQAPIPECECDDPKDVILETPPGLIANPHVVSICTPAEIATFECSADAQVGYVILKYPLGGFITLPIYRTVPTAGEASLFVFTLPFGTAVPQYIAFNARTESDYGLNIETIGISHLLPIEEYTTVIWGVPGAHVNDPLRFGPGEVALDCPTNPIKEFEEHFISPACENYAPEGGLGQKTSIPTQIPIKPLIQNPTRCSGPLTSSLETTSYDLGTDFAVSPWPATTGCDQLSFNPSLSANPTTEATDTASGIDVKLVAPQFQDPDTPSPSELHGATVTLPRGFSLNPNAADGKTVCTDAEARLGTREPAECPEHAKVGTVRIDSSALPGPIDGYVYLAEPRPGDPYRLMLTAYGFGTAVKIAGSVHADRNSGQLVVAFDELPESPFQEFDMHFFGSERGLLATPTQCGKFPVESLFTPWDNALSEQTSTQFFLLRSGPGGSSCPNGPRPFAPAAEGGGEDNTAGVHSPFSLRLNRADGEQELSAVNASLPPGLVATLRGIPYCPEAAIARLTETGYTGAMETASPACPASSQIGTVVSAEGAGTRPLYTPGKVYLAGPYKGAPLSLVAVVPAVSGPYDLGNVAVRVAVYVNPTTAQVTAVSDPLPQILEGIPVRLRSVLIRLDRKNFTLNPTNCEAATIKTVAHGTEGATSTVELPFQVANCSNLAFGPKLALSLKGKTRRAAFPALQAVLTAQPGEANIRRLAVTLPHTELLANGHLKAPCTRVAFAASACPAGSEIGTARVESPLIDQPLEGPVYLRASNHRLPDLVVDLHGQFHIELDGRIDSPKQRLRTTFQTVPDVPVTRFTLQLAGGRKGLLENSNGVCSPASKATVTAVGQNGERKQSRVRMKAACGSSGRSKRRLRHHRVPRTGR